MTFAALFAIWSLHLMAAISPGPAVLMSARVGILDGFRTGLFLSIGIGLGGVIWAATALLGLNLMFTAAPVILLAFKIIGGAYLVWLGWKIWCSAPEPLDMANSSVRTRSAWNTFVARIFSFDRSRRVYVGLKTIIDRVFGGFLALLGVKVAAT